jgi:hypothetical protein
VYHGSGGRSRGCGDVSSLREVERDETLRFFTFTRYNTILKLGSLSSPLPSQAAFFPLALSRFSFHTHAVFAAILDVR